MDSSRPKFAKGATCHVCGQRGLVVDSRAHALGFIVRRRACPHCQAIRWTSFESRIDPRKAAPRVWTTTSCGEAA